MAQTTKILPGPKAKPGPVPTSRKRFGQEEVSSRGTAGPVRNGNHSTDNRPTKAKEVPAVDPRSISLEIEDETRKKRKVVLDFRPLIEQRVEHGVFFTASTKLASIYADVHFWRGLALAWKRRARQAGLDEASQQGITTASGREQYLREMTAYVEASSAVDIIDCYIAPLEWHLKLVQSGNATDREEYKHTV